MRFVAYPLIGAVVGCSIGAAAGFFGWLEYARINKLDGVAVGFGAAYFGFYLMLITGAVGAAIGAWRARLFRKRAVAADP